MTEDNEIGLLKKLIKVLKKSLESLIKKKHFLKTRY